MRENTCDVYMNDTRNTRQCIIVCINDKGCIYSKNMDDELYIHNYDMQVTVYLIINVICVLNIPKIHECVP